METKILTELPVRVNEEGFMLDPHEWNKDIAEQIAMQEGISSLSEAHWKVIDFCRREGLASGKAPTLLTIINGAGIPTKDLFSLFPKGPAKKVARISGLGKPEGCI
jgi:tRNA 2-thiouridine synthesizing protein E